MKTLLKSVAFGLLAVGAAVAVTGAVFSPWYAGLAFGLAACGCVMGMCQLFGYDVG